MKTSIVQTAFYAIALVLLAAAQDAMPAFAGTKPPLVALVAVFAAWYPVEEYPHAHARTSHAAMAVAVAAGFLLDALDDLPFGCAIIFLLIAGVAVRPLRTLPLARSSVLTGLLSAVVLAPLFEIWLRLWLPACQAGSLFVRMFAAMPPAAVMGAVLFPVLAGVRRHAGLEVPPRLPRGGAA